jgi:sarcosine oxidase subunit alpha
VRSLNQTTSVGAINVTGPQARELLARAGLTDPPGYMAHSSAEVAGVPCRVFRLSFTGEMSYELHHPADRSVDLWRALLDLGDDLAILPHGMDALLRLRLEKGHILIGQDTDYDSTPRRLDMDWAVDLSKPDFIGRHAVTRTDRLPLDKQLVGLEMEGEAPLEGVSVWLGDVYAGYVTSACWSPVLGKSVMLAWVGLFDGAVPDAVSVEGRTARRVPIPFYDPEGARARA